MSSNRAEPEGTLNATAECRTTTNVFSVCSLPTVAIPHEVDPDRDRSRVGGMGQPCGGRQAVLHGRKMMVHGGGVVHAFSRYLTEPPSVSFGPPNALSRNIHDKDLTTRKVHSFFCGEPSSTRRGAAAQPSGGFLLRQALNDTRPPTGAGAARCSPTRIGSPVDPCQPKSSRLDDAMQAIWRGLEPTHDSGWLLPPSGLRNHLQQPPDGSNHSRACRSR
ncbi:unnamed protein product [Ectocarpus sp. 12 AP-2014]